MTVSVIAQREELLSTVDELHGSEHSAAWVAVALPRVLDRPSEPSGQAVEVVEIGAAKTGRTAPCLGSGCADFGSRRPLVR